MPNSSQHPSQEQQPEVVPVVPTKKGGHKVKHYGPGIFASDFATATMVGISAAIPISVIDYSIMAKVAGVTDSSKRELIKGAKTLFTSPQKFFLPCAENHYFTVYRACTTVYFSTYLFSNTTKSLCESSGKFTYDQTNLMAGICSGFINIALTVWKDGIILKVLPPKNAEDLKIAKAPVPLFSRAMFATRDMLTCIAAFTIAPKVADWLSGRYRPDQLPLSSADCSQIVTPAALQTATTLIHITAIRYQRTGGNLAVPAFGIGGILNREARWSLLDKAEGKQ
eukprot:CAMPEP_0176423928 /NCGR_PEP_ID=MMETSP0127-20121128/10559_1 /TAXON_ID=938130 /ORGANISM="Platyophrya macrostoma, Strain WH" /LENGTH=281 /DNA_ID=CAMNT_0017804939 /DNA_START=3 /DNA_END=848 /DNA_ORIENTATION=-